MNTTNKNKSSKYQNIIYKSNQINNLVRMQDDMTYHIYSKFRLNIWMTILGWSIVAVVFCLPSDAQPSGPLGSVPRVGLEGRIGGGGGGGGDANIGPSTSSSSTTSHNPIQAFSSLDYYQFRHTVAVAINTAIKECRELYKWDKWNCPQKPFIDILLRKLLPANKEMAYIRSLISALIVQSMTRACGFGTGTACGCDASRINFPLKVLQNETNNESGSPPSSSSTGFSSDLDHEGYSKQLVMIRNKTDEEQVSAQFAWQGCDESVHFAFEVAKMYLESQEYDMDQTNKLINAHNYRAGRLAVKRTAKRICKCHGISGSCQISTCWIGMPSTRQVAEYLRKLHRAAIKVGPSSAQETDSVQLAKELNRTKTNKLVFIDPSPDYCYENLQHGINGTLGRYCMPSMNQNSCDRLCTKCGYKIKRVTIQVERQCDCRFKYCCSVECKRCTKTEEVYKCAKHGH